MLSSKVVHRLEASEGALDGGQALVGTDRGAGIEDRLWHRSADYVDAVQTSLLSDGVGFAFVTERGLGDRGLEVLGHLEPPQDPTDAQPDHAFPAQRPALALSRHDDLVQLVLGST